MTKTLNALAILITLAGCSDWAANLTPEQRAFSASVLLQSLAIQNSRPLGQNNTYDPAIAGMIGRPVSPIYLCTAYGCL